MGRKLTRDEFLHEIFHDYDTMKAAQLKARPASTLAARVRTYDQMKNEGQLRLVRVRVPGREVSLAHLIGVSQKEVYQNLGLHIGVHEGEDHTGDTLGLLKFTPWEATVVAADIAIKSGNVEIGFLDRFCGALILTGSRSDIRSSIEGVVAFFRDELHFPVCEITES